MKYIVTINSNNYEVEVEQGEARVIKATESAVIPVVAQMVTAADTDSVPPQTKAPAAIQTAGGDKIVAPMPGTILQIKKNNGEQVKKGEIIFILEAMKMENEILAPKDGIISQIITVKDATVNTGDILAVMQ